MKPRVRHEAGILQVILASEGYQTRAACQKGIASVQKYAPSGSAFTQKEAKDGGVYFTLNAKNGEVIGSSQMDKSARSRAKGIVSVIRNAAGGSVKDLSA